MPGIRYFIQPLPLLKQNGALFSTNTKLSTLLSRMLKNDKEEQKYLTNMAIKQVVGLQDEEMLYHQSLNQENKKNE